MPEGENLTLQEGCRVLSAEGCCQDPARMDDGTEGNVQMWWAVSLAGRKLYRGTLEPAGRAERRSGRFPPCHRPRDHTETRKRRRKNRKKKKRDA